VGFLTQRFPDRIARGAVGGPEYLTTVAYVTGGANQRNIDRALPLHTWSVSQGIKSDADARLCDAHFRKAKGRGHSFRFKDWWDYSMVVAESRLVLITSTTFQLAKVYGTDEPTFEEVRPLTRIVAGTQKIYLDAVLQTLTTHYTINNDTGVVTFVSPPGAAVRTASCEFDVPCYYDVDDKQGELLHRRSNGTTFLRWENIRVREDSAG